MNKEDKVREIAPEVIQAVVDEVRNHLNQGIDNFFKLANIAYLPIVLLAANQLSTEIRERGWLDRRNMVETKDTGLNNLFFLQSGKNDNIRLHFELWQRDDKPVAIKASVEETDHFGLTCVQELSSQVFEVGHKDPQEVSELIHDWVLTQIKPMMLFTQSQIKADEYNRFVTHKKGH